MKKRNVVISALLAGLMSISVCGCGSTPAASGGTSGSEAGVTQYPAGTLTIYMNGNPQYRQQYFETWLEEHRDIAPEVEVEFVQVESNADAREKVTMTALAGATEDLPDAVFLDRLNLMDLVEADLLLDETEFLSPLVDKMVDGAVDEGIVQEKMYGLPDSVRPQLLMYNKAIFDQYGIDPEMMATMDGYIEAGRQLKEKSNGEVYLSWIGSNDMTWKCWGRRGLMPQANAKIWDDEGNVVIGQDEGTKLALGTLDTLYSEGLLMRVEMYDPAMYDATNNHQIATYYLGAYWDEFMRQNCQATAGEWRVMSAPVFEEVGTAGAPVSSYMCIVNKGEDTVYQGLLEQI